MAPSRSPLDFDRTTRVFVLGLGTNGLGAIRSLGEQGVRVAGVDWEPRPFAAFSRYCARAVVCPHPAQQPRRVLDLLFQEARRLERPAVLLPTTDVFLEFVALHARDLRGHFLFALPDSPLREALTNKRLQYALAEQVGTPFPRTFYPRDQHDLARIAPEFRYPALLKPFASHLWYPRFRKKVMRVDGPRELERCFAEAAASGLEVMVQQAVVGPTTNEYNHHAYIDGDNRVLASFTRRKLRQFPTDFGTATLAESVRCDEVERLALGFLQAIQYRGPCGVQVKRDARDGRYYLLELNGRMMGANIHPTRCGVNVPLVTYLDLTGQSPAPLLRYRVGVRHLDLVPDVQACLALRREGKLGAREWLGSLASARVFAHFDPRDPLPFLAAHQFGLLEAKALLGVWRARARRR